MHFLRSVRTFVRLVVGPARTFDRWLCRGPRRHWALWPYRVIGPPLLAVSLLVIWALTYVYVFPGDRTDVGILTNWDPPQVGHLTDCHGEVFFRMYDNEVRTVVPYAQIPTLVRNAFIAAEDGDFWENDGWDKQRTAVAILKATFSKVFGYRPQGASGITQQVMRKVDPVTADLARRERGTELIGNGITTHIVALVKGPVFANRTARKWREIKRSVRMESALVEYFTRRGEKYPIQKTKETILGVYLNAAYFGHGVYGIAEASSFYFHKSVGGLTASEAAFLASLLPAPNVYAQLNSDRTAAKNRRDAVLNRMARDGYLGEAALVAALDAPLNRDIRLLQFKTEAPAAVNRMLFADLPETGMSRDQLLRGSIQVRTTLCMDIQRVVNTAVEVGLYGNGTKSYPGFTGLYPQAAVPQVALVVLGSRGEILAMHGGEIRDAKYRYNAHMQLNRAVSLQQPGSTFKIIDNMAAMMAGYTPETRVSDAPVSLCMSMGIRGRCTAYKSISNYKEEHLGTLPLYEFSARSVNTAYIRLMRDMVGNTPLAYAAARDAHTELVTQTGHRVGGVDGGAALAVKVAAEMGVTTPLQPYLSTVLGASEVTVLDMANVIRTACTGRKARVHLINRIVDTIGTALYEDPNTTTAFPASPEKIQQVQQLLYGNVRLPHGTAHSLDTAEFGIEVAAKTGTSNDNRDAWFCVCSGDGTSIAVWVGYDNNTPLPADGLPLYRKASGGRVALPIARYTLENLYGSGKPLGAPPKFKETVKDNVNAYLANTHPDTDK